jgi:hypothetical protein
VSWTDELDSQSTVSNGSKRPLAVVATLLNRGRKAVSGCICDTTARIASEHPALGPDLGSTESFQRRLAGEKWLD